jgi:predicted ATPase/DNA-binding SARP family transcriptional activator
MEVVSPISFAVPNSSVSASPLIPPSLSIRLLGGIVVLVQGIPLPKLRGRQGLRLLAILALRSPQTVERSHLAGMLWPENTEENALALLRRNLTDLRQALGSEGHRIISPTRYTLQLVQSEGLWLDTIAFKEGLAQEKSNSSENGASSIRDFEDVIGLYRGPLMEGFHDAWLVPEREQYQLLMLEALQHRATHVAPEEAISLLRRALIIDPLREKNCCALMETLALQGDIVGIRATFKQFQKSLRRSLNTEPNDQTTQLYHRLLREGARTPAKTTHIKSLPHPLTTFMGREVEQAHLQKLLRTSTYRLITLTGLGGVGKTRLALETVRPLSFLFPGGIHYLSLSEIAEPQKIPSLLAQAIGAPAGTDKTALERVVRVVENQSKPSRRMLLVLDNLEHLIVHKDAPLFHQMLTTLLESCPMLTCLATSRLSLKILGEREVPVPPLKIPDTSMSLTALSSCASVALFQDRAQSLRPSWQLTNENATQVVDICRSLEGSPLAIELATGTMRGLSLEQLLHRLKSPLTLVADRSHQFPKRHQSLHAVLEGSYRLLSPPMQHFFADLSVFRGRFNLEAMNSICQPPQGIGTLDALMILAEHSLLPSPIEEEYYALQEVVREFASECLERQGRLYLVQKRHAIYFGKLAVEVREGLQTPQQDQWHKVMDNNYQNTLTALDNLAGHSTDENIAHYLEILMALSRFWERRSYFQEAYQRCEQGLNLHNDRPHTDYSAHALMRMGVHCWRFRELTRSRAYSLQALAYYEAKDNFLYQADCNQNLGNVAGLEENLTESRLFFERGLEMARRSGDLLCVASLLGNMGWITNREGNLSESIVFYEEQLSLRRQLGDMGRVARSLSHLGNASREIKDYTRARRHYTESLILHRRFKNDYAIANDLCGIGRVAHEQGDYGEAWQQCKEAFERHQRLGISHEILYDLRILANIARDRGDLLTALRLWATIQVHDDTALSELIKVRDLCLLTQSETETIFAEVSGRLATLADPLPNLAHSHS